MYELKDIKDFNPTHIFECGQCFRWNKQLDNSYTGICGKNVINVKEENNTIVFKGICNGDIEDVCKEYFDLKEDYNKIKQKLVKADKDLETSIVYANGIRILQQDLWETLISFIISANNNIPRIKKIIEKISKEYGEKIDYKNKEYYVFPSPQQLSKATVEDLRKLGLGFRDKRVYQTTQMVVNKVLDLKKIEKEKNTKKVKEELLKFPGVGPKVADCIMLFALKKFEVFPIDVWVKRVMTELYFNQESKTSNTKIQKLAEQKYGKLAGIAQQYLFYWRRNEHITSKQ